MIKELLTEIKKSSFSVLPIYVLVLFLCLIKVISLTGFEILSFSLATILVIIGISLFNFGADRAMTPIGKMVGKGLTKQGKVWILLIVVLLFGFFITIAEPDLAVLASQTAARSENDKAASRSIRAPERLKLVNISFHNLYLALYSTIKADFELWTAGT